MFNTINRMNADKVTYVFGHGRLNKLGNKDYSDEFYYGYNQFVDSGFDTSIIEFHKEQKTIYLLLDKIIRKFLKLPSYTNQVINKNNLDILNNSDVVIFTNERTYLASYLMYRKSLRIDHSKRSAMFVMGLFSKLSDRKILFFIQKIILLKVLNSLDSFYFLGIGEMDYAKKIFPSLSSKFYYLPFVINKEFWEINESPNIAERSNILFIGNDGNRDYDKAIRIAELLSDENFIFITENINESELTVSNIKLINGHWNKSKLTDTDMIKFYDKAKLTFIPLKESLQPSGQSVTLQSMARGVPVMITNTSGFWDRLNYEHNKNILFIEENNAENWALNIKKFSKDQKKAAAISHQTLKTSSKLNNREAFFSLIKKNLNIQ